MRVTILTNAPSPYRVDFFEFLSKNYGEDFDFFIIFSASNEDIGRAWENPGCEDKDANENQNMQQSTQGNIEEAVAESYKTKYFFLHSKTLSKQESFDTKTITFASGIWALLKKLSPQVVVIAEYNPTALMTALYCRLHHIPYISWTDGTIYSERNLGKAQRISRKWMIRGARGFLASSTKAKENQIYLGAQERRIRTSLLTVDIEKYRAPKHYSEKSDRIHLICVGSLIERKGIDLLLREMAQLPSKYDLTIVGDGILRKDLEEMASKLEIADRVSFTGFLTQQEVKKEYEKADIFVLLTREDCFGLVILEAMCAGLPVVVSKYADGAVDLVVDGQNGFIVDIDTEGAAAKAIQMVDAEAMGRAAYESIDRFAFAKVSQGFMSAITEVSGREK